MKTIRAADLFCGAGGTSTGLALACEDLGLKVDLLALDHWDVAIQTHEANHPWARHLCKSLHEVDPRRAIPGGRLDLLVASPECTHHSIARGGRPVSDQMRMSAWQIVDWLSALRVESVIVENVREFRDWGPIDSRGRPLKSRKGEIYQAFLRAIESLGYRVEERLLNAADFGDPTTRIRLFIMARKGRKPIPWPQPTHYPTGLLGERWVPARQIIDWGIRGESIFTRKRPLSPNTLARIYAGLRKFGGLSFVLPPLGYYHRNGEANAPRSTDRPLQTVTSRGGGHVVEPFLVALRGTAPDQLKHSTRSVEEPAPTVVANGNHLGVVEAYLVKYNGTGGAQSVDEPLDTVTTRDRFALVEIEGEHYLLDIRFRMLQPHELAAAMGFPAGYKFSGTRAEQVRQIGNAVAVRTAKALCRSILES